MTYQIGPIFRKPFTSECEAVLDRTVCMEYAEEGDEVAFVDDELACSGCWQFAREENGNDQQSWAQSLADRSRK